jgi:2-dehydropantoate 2-reductase
MTAILVVGGGAIGRVYGHHLAKGGADVSLFVRPRRVAEAERGLELARVRGRGARTIEKWTAKEVLSQASEIAMRDFDQIWITVPTDALAQPWVDELLAAAGDATIVGLQPGTQVAKRLGGDRPERLVMGQIGVIAWASPLERSTDPREREAAGAISYWFPPLTKTRFSGAKAADVARPLAAGGCPAGTVRDAIATLAFSSSVLLPLIGALEAAGWSLHELRKGPWLANGLGAAREMIAISAKDVGKRPPLFAPFLRSFLTAPFVALAPMLVPFDLEPYLEAHFTKVGAQTRALLATNVERGAMHGLPTPAIDALRAELEKTPQLEAKEW